jgi:hypothetical protein
MKIKFVKSAVPLGHAYASGAILDCNSTLGKEFIELGVAIELEDDSSTLPKDLPARDILILTGITSIDQLAGISTLEGLTAIKGIGKTLAVKILDFLGISPSEEKKEVKEPVKESKPKSKGK